MYTRAAVSELLPLGALCDFQAYISLPAAKSTTTVSAPNIYPREMGAVQNVFNRHGYDLDRAPAFQIGRNHPNGDHVS
jgi:hypothetical protein